MSEQINDGGPAFPVISKPDESGGYGHQAGSTVWQYSGMSLRDHFAGEALLGEITHQGLEGRDTEHIAAMAYEMADAMLAARTPKEPA